MSVCTFIASDKLLSEYSPVRDYPLDINIDTGLTLSAKKSVVSAEYSTTARLEVSASTKIASGVKYQWYEYVYDETEKKYFYDECEDWFFEDIELLTGIRNMERSYLNMENNH